MLPGQTMSIGAGPQQSNGQNANIHIELPRN